MKQHVEAKFKLCDDFVTGTIAPLPQDDQSTKPADCCILPGCRKSKYKDPDGTVHPYCGRTHAQLGKTRGISRML